MRLKSPSDIFGSLISDTEDFLDDLEISHRNSLGSNMFNTSTPSSPGFSGCPSLTSRPGTRASKSNYTDRLLSEDEELEDNIEDDRTPRSITPINNDSNDSTPTKVQTIPNGLT